MSIFDIFRGRDRGGKDDGIVVLKKTGPRECGGTDATLDKNAPKQILSTEMTLFDVTSSMRFITDDNDSEPLNYVSAWAAPACAEDNSRLGVFMYLEVIRDIYDRDEKKGRWAIVRRDIMPELVRLVNECDIASDNGYHSRTHGLPEDFGGAVRIEYASGERISFSDNQTPILKSETARRIAKLFEEAMSGDAVSLPGAASVTEIRFEEQKKNGGFTEAVLTINPDGTGTNSRRERYDGPNVYESTKPVSAGTIKSIRSNIDRTALAAWQYMPSDGSAYGADKSITLVFGDGSRAVISGDRLVPEQLKKGFFNIELELTVKN